MTTLNLSDRSDFLDWIRDWYLTWREYRSDNNGIYYAYDMYNGRKGKIWKFYDFIAWWDSCYRLTWSEDYVYLDSMSAINEFKKLLLY